MPRTRPSSEEDQLALPFDASATPTADAASDALPPETPQVVGALLGYACGDALGTPREFGERGAPAETHGYIEPFRAGPHTPAGGWSDETGMTVCAIEAILEAPDDPVPGAGTRFVAWADRAADIVGATITETLQRQRALGDW
ncbi:MAG: ADP-ribosylglycohydrolase family protein, partial [Acidobacteriota bacterium]